MARFYIRLEEAGRALADTDDLLAYDTLDVLAYDDLEKARAEATVGAKDLLCECIKTGRDPSGDAVLIVDSKGTEIERIALLDALPQLLRERMQAR
jgi:hypothetical protein